MKEIMCNYLTKRGSTYYFRRKSPLDLIHIYGKEIIFSLNTKDRKTAESLTRKKAVEYDEAFAEARKSLSNSPTPPIEIEVVIKPTNKPLEPIDINHAILKRVGTLRAAREREIANGEGKLWIQRIRGQLDANREYLQTGEHPLLDNPSVTEIEVFNIAASHILDGTALPFMAVLAPVSLASIATPNKDSKDNSIYFENIVRIWKSENTPRERTVTQYERIVRYFEELVGKFPVNQINRKHILLFKDALQEKASTPDKINNSIATLQILLEVACREDVIDINPAKGIRVPNKKLAKNSRLPFDLDALQIIFNSSIYTQGDRPSGGKGEAAYWLPLLALFTGARVEELCQLTNKDVRLESYLDEIGQQKQAWIIHITDEGLNQKLKNQGSIRIVPLHTILIELGFIDYVKKQSEGLIFPLLVASKYNEISSNWSKWFGRYLRRDLKITDKRMVFHSFRHTFKDYARSAGISTEVHHAITGHSMGNAGDNYGGDFPMLPLVRAIEKYSVPNLKIAGILK